MFGWLANNRGTCGRVEWTRIHDYCRTLQNENNCRRVLAVDVKKWKLEADSHLTVCVCVTCNKGGGGNVIRFSRMESVVSLLYFDSFTKQNSRQLLVE